jgi:hypothetical protein
VIERLEDAWLTPHLHCSVIFEHTTATSPKIYVAGNFANPINLQSIPLALADEACIHALAAFGGFRRHFLKSKYPQLVDCHGTRTLEKWHSEAAFRLHEAARLMNKKLENAKEALSIASVTAAGILGACTVRTLVTLVKSLYVLLNT